MRFHAHGILEPLLGASEMAHIKTLKREFGFIAKKESTFKCDPGAYGKKTARVMCLQTSGAHITALSLWSLIGLLYLYMIGICLSCVAFVIELLLSNGLISDLLYFKVD